jgi:hypothetical protein
MVLKPTNMSFYVTHLFISIILSGSGHNIKVGGGGGGGLEERDVIFTFRIIPISLTGISFVAFEMTN